LTCLAFLGLTACGSRSHEGASSQVVVLVNGQPITAAQVEQALRSEEPPASGADDASGADETTAQVVESLVNEQLLVQGALEQHLELDPVVAQALENARREVLARFFAEMNLYPKETISTAEVRSFYAAHPILFVDRKRFTLRNYSFEAIELDQRLRSELEDVHSDHDLHNLLDKYDIKYTAQTESMSADQLPLDKLSEFEHASVGDVMIATRSGGNAVLMSITGIQGDSPISFDRAKPYIESYLSNVRNRKAVSQYLEKVKASAQVIYAHAPDPRHDPGQIAVLSAESMPTGLMP